MVKLERENALDKLVCKVRDCFIPSAHNKYMNGTDAHLCFKRRRSSDPVKAVINVAKLYLHLSAFCAYNPGRFEQGSKDNAQLIESARRKRMGRMAKGILVIDNLAEKGQINGWAVFTEDLLNYETDSSSDGLARSVRAWEIVLRAWQFMPDTDTDTARIKSAITEVLSTEWGTRDAPSPHRDVIYNHDEVRAALFNDEALSHFRWMWRD